ncbi:hypothetical protein JOE21_003533 [Desmospora profundinema]|uniref:Uncharacterized protein n=1 Tax=Desmospora profundinema TaxID=1571184 RepID=A0ABU1IRT3_9BACL|nr:hypothetical protein [Desmospora profundinema]
MMHLFFTISEKDRPMEGERINSSPVYPPFGVEDYRANPLKKGFRYKNVINRLQNPVPI